MIADSSAHQRSLPIRIPRRQPRKSSCSSASVSSCHAMPRIPSPASTKSGHWSGRSSPKSCRQVPTLGVDQHLLIGMTGSIYAAPNSDAQISLLCATQMRRNRAA